MKVAIVHDYLREYGGAERVVEALHEIFPQAPIYTAYYRPEGLGPHAERVKNWDIRTSWLQKVPLANKLISPLRILAPMIFEGFDLSSYDVVISSSAIYFAKAVMTSPQTLHLAYIHTPPRYLYGITTSFEAKKHNFLVKIGVAIINHILRIYDFETSQRPDILVANSKNVAERIKKFYRRDSVVIYPPVEVGVEKVKSSSQNSKTYYLSICRLWKNKNVDIIIEACQKLGLPLKVVGVGPELQNLKKLAKNDKNIEFLGEVSDEKKDELYAGSKALIVAALDEDFGITPLEAMAAGTPVIAPASGGFLETVVDGPPSHKSSARQAKTGILYGGQGIISVETLINALQRFNDSNHFNNPKVATDCRKQAEKFSKERFKKEILELINKASFLLRNKNLRTNNLPA